MKINDPKLEEYLTLDSQLEEEKRQIIKEMPENYEVTSSISQNFMFFSKMLYDQYSNKRKI